MSDISLKWTTKQHNNLAELLRQADHDIRAPLGAMEILARDLAKDSHQHLELIRTCIKRIKDITHHLSSVSHENSRQLLPFDILKPIKNVVAEKIYCLDKTQSRTKIQLNANHDDVIIVKANEGQLLRLLSNLLDNSVRALQEQQDNPNILIDVIKEYSDIKIVISDNGPGVDHKKAKQLGKKGVRFAKGKGCGLGLHHAKTCIEFWEGSFEIETEANKGFKVIMRLPIKNYC